MKIKAPEFKSVKWINSKPIKLENLQGKPVLVIIWTYTCINCLHTLPYVNKWHKKYKNLEIIGIHSPEFHFEKNEKNLKKAIKELGILFPVCMDNKLEMWEAYNNNYWPARFLIDQDGYIRYAFFGEGNFEETEEAMQILLDTTRKKVKTKVDNFFALRSPKIYTGFKRNMGIGSGLINNRYVDLGEHVRELIYPDGVWEQNSDSIELLESPGKLSIRFIGDKVNIVLEPISKVSATIFINMKKIGEMRFNRPGIYTIYSNKNIIDRELSVVFKGKVKIYSLSFI